MTFCCTHRSVPCSAIIREASYSRWDLTQRLESLQRVRNLGALSPKWDVFIKHCLILGYYCYDETPRPKATWRGRGPPHPYTSTSQSILEGSQGGNSRQELKIETEAQVMEECFLYFVSHKSLCFRPKLPVSVHTRVCSSCVLSISKSFSYKTTFTMNLGLSTL